MAEYLLHIVETPGGGLAVDGLPLDRDERMSLTYRLLDVIRAVQHSDTHTGAGDDLSDGQAWQRYAKAAYAKAMILGEDV